MYVVVVVYQPAICGVSTTELPCINSRFVADAVNAIDAVGNCRASTADLGLIRCPTLYKGSIYDWWSGVSSGLPGANWFARFVPTGFWSWESCMT